MTAPAVKPSLTGILAVSTRIDLRSIKDTDNGIEIEGIANDANKTDSFKTRFQWTDECIERSTGGIVLFNHGPSEIAGKNLEMDRNRAGSLWIRDVIDLTPVMPNGLTYADAIRREYLNGLSIRFDEDAKFIRGKEFDTIIPNLVPEHSIVSLPSNRSSRISDFTRSILAQLETEPAGREIAHAFRLAVPGLRDMRKESTVPQDKLSDAAELTPEQVARRDHRTPESTRGAGVLDFGVLYQRLAKAMRELNEYAGEYAWRNGIYCVMDDAVIISCEYGTFFYKHGYTVDADGNVTIASQRVEVIPSWTEVNTGVTSTLEERADPRLHPDDIRAVVDAVLERMKPAETPLENPPSPAERLDLKALNERLRAMRSS